MGIDLPLIWILIIAFGLMMYVVMDGFDLGIGILFPFVPLRSDRDLMVNTVAPVWDGNETWLVLGGAGLLAAFPLAYSVLLSALYIPVVLMLMGLILRGVAFEFRFKADESHRPFWDVAFAGGSYTAAFFQGAALGAFIDGFTVTGPSYDGGALDWLTPFSVFTGIGVIVAYALLGSTWLTMKTEGALQGRMILYAKRIVPVLLVGIGIVSLWTPLAHAAIARRWFSVPDIFYFAPVPILVLATSWQLMRLLTGGSDGKVPHAGPFLLALFLLFLGYSGLAISLWPNIIPPGVSFRAAAAPPQSQGFALVGALLIVPIILAYTGWAYYVFRGKVREGEGYH
ncbi:cytochrome d ubiquinol oxidase subunit II [Acidisphaera sp. S103]|uniref:cytochrome d ubiquinol oxidase subunit II n=1 Tax=Acidisphaera sp. S103 TaxID=1747223 RepID=UPI00131D902C|nr:cytochrome d ubiquinol oxidase subunit II [Acidisphaera sp. S103]